MTPERLNTRDRLLIAAIAVLSALLLFAALLLLALGDYRNAQASHAEQALSDLTRIIDETNVALEELNALPYEGCGVTADGSFDDNLTAMHRVLFKGWFVRDVGFFVDDQLVCTTGRGKLPTPYVDPEPDYELLNGNQVWQQIPLALFDERFPATIIRNDRYNVVLHSERIGQLLAWDPSWALLLRRGDALRPIAGDAALLERRDLTAAGLLTLGYLDCVPEQTYCLALQGSWNHLLRRYDTILVLFGVIGTLAGVLAGLGARAVLRRRRSLTARIRRGFASGCFFAQYQPIVELRTGRIVGCEVLARFADHRGPVFPDRFIPVIRELGLSWPFTVALMDQALDDLDARRNLPDGFRVGFNIFPQDLVRNETAALVRDDYAARTRFQLVLEITEDEYLEGKDAQDHLRTLLGGGFQIAIDDFGTGYANLNHLKKVQCTLLKIDRSFVNEVEDGSIKSSLIPHITAIARDLGLRVVAEGVENVQQRDALIEAGVSYGQGWAFGKPMPSAALADRLSSQAAPAAA